MATLRPRNRLSYWARRVLEDEAAAARLAEEAGERIRQLYLTQYKKTVLQMERLYAQVQNEKTPSRTQLWDYSRWREMEKGLSSFIKGGSLIEAERVTGCLDKVFEQVIGAPVERFSGQDAARRLTATIDPKTVINTAWSGENYSSRIWKNRTALADRIRVDMEAMVAGNMSMTDARREIMHEFNVGWNQADRLVRTEASYVFNRTTLERYKSLGVERVEWITQETGYCKTCHERDGLIYMIHSAPVIPAHPNCHCTYAAYTDADEWLDLGGDEAEDADSSENRAELAKTVESGIMESGALTSKNDPSFKRREAHAESYYQSVRNSDMKYIVRAIVQNTGIDWNTVETAIRHAFYTKHDLEKGHTYFDSDFNMAESVRRLRLGKEIQEHDLILIQHEAMEAGLMTAGMTYEDAHDATNLLYNYKIALLKFLDDNELW